ncbi:unnamed protein product [Strongylus vulgaris]|uniref:Uncharacterized protein n=1 Tax=Strongylus vulgaris TaxID=40348 RepID=A0A3P7JDM8_STRVU|nr:unnamed protein product [Strongylus vulgaris]
MFNVEDYTTWANTFEKFWWFFAIDKETDEPVGSVTLSFERVINMAQRYAEKYGFNKMPNYTHDNAIIPTERIIMPKPDPQYIIKDLRDVDDAKVIAYDAAISQRKRGKFLTTFMTAGECYPKYFFYI